MEKEIYNWLILVYYLPPEAGSARVRIWRKMKKLGMVSFRNSVYFLPYSDENHEITGWLCQEIQKAGGDATLLKVESVENMTNEEVAALFRKARDEDYGELAKGVSAWLGRLEGLVSTGQDEQIKDSKELLAMSEGLKAFEKRLTEILDVDFFGATGRRSAEELIARGRLSLRRLTEKSTPAVKALTRLYKHDFQGQAWVTRPRPHIDRIATAWAIRRFIDPEASFEFADDPGKTGDAVPFDYVDTDFSHQGEDCTLETLIGRFGLTDKRLGKIAKIVHDADLKDAKFGSPESAGLDVLIRGMAAETADDHELMERGAALFEALYAGLAVKRAEKTRQAPRQARPANKPKAKPAR